MSSCPGQSLWTINLRGTPLIGGADAAHQWQGRLWAKACVCGPAGDASIRALLRAATDAATGACSSRLVLRVLDDLTPRLVFDALERLEIAERTERHGHTVVPDDVEVEDLEDLERISAAHEMVLRELVVGVPEVDVGVARERLLRCAKGVELLRSLRVGRAVVHRDLARVQQANPRYQPGHSPWWLEKWCLKMCFVSISVKALTRRAASVGPYHVEPTVVGFAVVVDEPQPLARP
jgi:hypothetical protein